MLALIAMHPYYIARAIGGLLFLIGTIIGCYNIWMTIRAAPQTLTTSAADLPEARLPAAPVLQPGE